MKTFGAQVLSIDTVTVAHFLAIMSEDAKYQDSLR